MANVPDPVKVVKQLRRTAEELAMESRTLAERQRDLHARMLALQKMISAHEQALAKARGR